MTLGAQSPTDTAAALGRPLLENTNDRTLTIVSFLEHYLPPEQTFIYRQMTGLPHCKLWFVARYLLPQTPYPTEALRIFGSHKDVPRPSAWRAKARRLVQRLSRRYRQLGSGETAALEAILRQLSPDLLHAHWAPDAMLARPLCEKLGIPLLVHFHGYDVSRLVSDPIYIANLRELFAQMQFSITVSEHMRQRVIELGCPPAMVLAHHTGVPDDYFVQRTRRYQLGQEFILLQVGRFVDKKGHAYTIEAFATALRHAPQLRLRLVGYGPLEDALRKQMQALGIADKVDILPFKSSAEVIELMKAADALVTPSHTADDGDMEGIPNVVVEAAAGALPVIATTHAGIPEVIRYSEPGWLAAEREVSALADRMQRLAADPALCERFSREGREIARADYHLPTQNARLETLYRRIVGEYRKKG